MADASSRPPEQESLSPPTAPIPPIAPAAPDPPPAPGPDEYASQEMLRAMAHPVRLQLVERLGRRGTARAADLADDMGIPANSVSYHLRILARGGVIAEAPEAARDRRDRVWKLSQSSYYAQPSEEDTQDPERKDSYQAASTALGLAALDWIRDAFVRHPAKGKGPGKGRMMSTSLHISHGQAEELGLALHELVDHYREMNRDAEGRDLEGDPDTDGEATDYRVMFALVADTEPSTRP